MLIYVSAFLNIISKQLTIRILDQIQFANYVINSLRISSDATSESSLWNDFILLPFVLEISEFSKHVFFNSCHYGHNRKLRHSSWFSGVFPEPYFLHSSRKYVTDAKTETDTNHFQGEAEKIDRF